MHVGSASGVLSTFPPPCPQHTTLFHIPDVATTPHSPLPPGPAIRVIATVPLQVFEGGHWRPRAESQQQQEEQHLHRQEHAHHHQRHTPQQPPPSQPPPKDSQRVPQDFSSEERHPVSGRSSSSGERSTPLPSLPPEPPDPLAVWVSVHVAPCTLLLHAPLFSFLEPLLRHPSLQILTADKHPQHPSDPLFSTSAPGACATPFTLYGPAMRMCFFDLSIGPASLFLTDTTLAVGGFTTSENATLVSSSAMAAHIKLAQSSGTLASSVRECLAASGRPGLVLSTSLIEVCVCVL